MPKDEKEKLVPNLRFKGFTDDWILYKLKDVSKRITRKNKEQIANIPLTISDKFGLIDQREYFTKKIASKDMSHYILLKKGEFAYNKSYSKKNIFGTVARLDNYDMGALSTLYIAFEVENADSTFIQKYYESDKWHYGISKIANEGARNHGLLNISTQDFFDTRIKTPNNLDEQTKIGIILEKLDNIITLEQEKREWLEEIKEYLITKLFSNSSRIPDLRFNNFIDRWDKYQLFELGDYYNGLSGKTKKDFGHGEAEYIVYKNVYSNPIADVSGIDKVEIDLKQNEVRYGDILFTTSSETPDEVGLTSVWMETKKNVYLNSFCFGFRPNRYINPYFIAYYLRSDYFRNQMIPLAQGISRYNISKIKVMDLEIILPDREEQDKIGNAFKLLDESLIANREKLKRLKKVKAMLLQNLFI